MKKIISVGALLLVCTSTHAAPFEIDPGVMLVLMLLGLLALVVPPIYLYRTLKTFPVYCRLAVALAVFANMFLFITKAHFMHIPPASSPDSAYIFTGFVYTCTVTQVPAIVYNALIKDHPIPVTLIIIGWIAAIYLLVAGLC